jgi:N-acetylneuraminate lyase
MKKLPNLAGIKNSSESIRDIQIFKDAGGNDFIVFNGMDPLFIAGRVMGADGGIGGTYGPMPELYLVLDKLVNEQRMEEARVLQNKINHIIETLHSFTNLYCVAKAILELRGLKTGGVRLPFLPLSSADIPRLNELHTKIMELIDVYSN